MRGSGVARINARAPSSPPETRIVPRGVDCVDSVFDAFWWMQRGCCHSSDLEEDEGRDQKTAWPSVPAVKRSVGERRAVCVRQDVE